MELRARKTVKFRSDPFTKRGKMVNGWCELVPQVSKFLEMTIVEIRK